MPRAQQRDSICQDKETETLGAAKVQLLNCLSGRSGPEPEEGCQAINLRKKCAILFLDMPIVTDLNDMVSECVGFSDCIEYR